MNWIFIFPFFIGFLGLCFGSFSNALIYRIKNKESILKGRSHCPRCKHTLGVFDLFPIFSWIFLNGKCRYCKTSISLQYPLVELTFGILWTFTTLNLGIPENISEWTYFLFILYVVSSLVIITVYDILYFEIPDEISLPVIGLTFFSFYLNTTPSLKNGLLGTLIIYSFFYLQIIVPSIIYSFKKKSLKYLKASIKGYFLFPIWIILSIFLPQNLIERITIFSNSELEDDCPSWIGGGDLRIAFIMGLLLGIKGSIIALFLAYFLGAVIGIILILSGKRNRKSMIPFGPFLSIGIFISLFWGIKIWDWYWSLLGI